MQKDVPKYILRIIALVIFSVVSSGISAQRFTERIADSIIITRKQAFATTENFAGNDTELFFDFYEPAKDSLSYRPLVITVFGGSFVIGQRDWLDMQTYGDSLAHYGYVVASIDYRLGYNPMVRNGLIRAAYRAGQDVNAAIRFFKANYDTYGIDTSCIFLLGNSAGSIASLTSVYLDDSERPDKLFDDKNLTDPGCFNCSGSYQQHTTSVTGVISQWGGLNDPAYINCDETTPVCFIHGLDDKTVPYDVGPAYGINLLPKIYGSEYLSSRLDSLGIWHELHLFSDEKHCFYLEHAHLGLIPEKFDTCLNIALDFMAKLNPRIKNPQFAVTGKPVLQAPVNLYRKNHLVLFNSLSGAHRYRLLTVEGRLVKSGYTFLQRGINLEDVEKGIYVLEISNNEGQVIKKVSLK